MEYIEGFANNNGVNIYYIDNGVNNSNKTPLIVCPGLVECAVDYIKLIDKINDRRCIAISFRGRGISDAPSEGYTLQDHINDIESVIKELKIEKFCILGMSRGVCYSLGYSILNVDKLKGIIISEYPPKHNKVSNRLIEEDYNKNKEFLSISYEVLKKIEEEADEVDFKDDLKKITCPVLIIKRELNDSLLNNEDLSDYVTNLSSKSIIIKKFDNSSSHIKNEYLKKLSRTIESFLIDID